MTPNVLTLGKVIKLLVIIHKFDVGLITMMNGTQQAEFENLFPFMKMAKTDFKKDFYNKANLVELNPGASIGEEGELCTHLAMVLDGVARVYKLSPNGREVTLYRIYPGESCVLTASCIMNQGHFPAMAETETKVRAIVIPPSEVRHWFCGEPKWQEFIFGLLSHRLANIITVVEEIAFKRIDVRIADQLSKMMKRGEVTILKTHADLAADVGSSREVVSRILKDMTQRGMISSSRGHIEILDTDAIIKLSKH